VRYLLGTKVLVVAISRVRRPGMISTDLDRARPISTDLLPSPPISTDLHRPWPPLCGNARHTRRLSLPCAQSLTVIRPLHNRFTPLLSCAQSLTALALPTYLLVLLFTFFGTLIFAVEYDPRRNRRNGRLEFMLTTAPNRVVTGDRPTSRMVLHLARPPRCCAWRDHHGAAPGATTTVLRPTLTSRYCARR
jgi:hypothetical protein